MFVDRRDAGRHLARSLRAYAGRSDVIVLALPRGGVPVAYEVAEALDAPLDVFLVRKLGMPGQEEFAIGAVASGGLVAYSPELLEIYDLSENDIERIVERESVELSRRERLYRADRPPPDVRNKTVILVDDGLATGSSMHAAVLALGRSGPARVVVAVPVASREACETLQEVADGVVCLETPQPFRAVGLWYSNFEQTSDDEVLELLRLTRERRRGRQPGLRVSSAQAEP